MIDMQPQDGDYSIQIPITFDYKGGRGEYSVKNKIILTVVFIVLFIIATVFLCFTGIEVWQKLLYIVATFCVLLWLFRYIVMNESYFSDIYETMLERDFSLYTEDMWQIFDIDTTYPYICYFKNGQKGIFVSMEKDAIIGKPASAVYDHYEAISEAYNLAHSLNMNIVHIDYMDNVGNDKRLQEMIEESGDIKNPDMRNMIRDIYTNLEDEMTTNYASHDIYLFLTREDKSNFFYNVQGVANTMLGGNFITYTVMDRDELSIMCSELFNFYEFSVLNACHQLIKDEVVGGIRPISVTHGDGTVEVLNLTTKEAELERETKARQEYEREEEQRNKRHKKRREEREKKKLKKKGVNVDVNSDDTDTDLDLF